MIFLAYDGSINGDWVSRYAVRMAANAMPYRLTVVNVAESQSNADQFVEKLGRIELECRPLEIAFDSVMAPPGGSVAESVCRVVPAGPESFLVCGTRVREHRRGLLAGTVSEELLRRRHCRTLAIRVLQPGLLGLPRNLLVPLAGHPRGLTDAIPFHLRSGLPAEASLGLLTIQE